LEITIVEAISMPIMLIIDHYVTAQNHKLLSNPDLLIDRKNRNYLSINLKFLSKFCKLSKNIFIFSPVLKRINPILCPELRLKFISCF